MKSSVQFADASAKLKLLKMVEYCPTGLTSDEFPYEAN